MFLYFVVFVLVILCLLHFIWSYSEVRKLPGPKGLFFIGNTFDIAYKPEEQFYKFRQFAETYDERYVLWITGYNVVNIYNPDDVEVILGSTKHDKKGMIYKYFKPWLRDGLLLSSGPKWHQRRKILTPAFHFNILRQFCITMNERSEQLVKSLERRNDPIDVLSLMAEFSLNTLCETAMGTKLDEESSGAGIRYKNAINKLGELIYERASNVLLIPEFPYNKTTLAKKIDTLIKTIHSFTKNVICERKKQFNNGKIEKDEETGNGVGKRIAFLDLLISAEAEGLIDNVGIQEEVDTFMLEGSDTTARGLTYCLMLIANHKDIQDKICTELYEVLGASNNTISMDDLPKLRYLECCIKEALRLYPPVPLISRKTTEIVTLSNRTVPVGTNVHVHIYDLHRRKDLFKDPLVFNPDRFLAENSLNRHIYGYIPFSTGPRNCIGRKFAMMEMKICLSIILQNYELQAVTRPEDIRFRTDFVLRSVNPVRVKFVLKNAPNREENTLK